MSANSRFTVAVHALTLLDEPAARRVTSDWIAQSVKTNPVVVRRTLSRLMDAGLVEGARGAGGGYRLARPASRITLWDAYLAVREEGLFGLHRCAPNPRCPVGRNIQAHLERLYERAEESMKTVLAKTTVRALRQRVTGMG